MTTTPNPITALAPISIERNPFQIEADRNSAVETLVRATKRQGFLDYAIQILRDNPAVEVPALSFGRFDRSLTEFSAILEAAANRPDADELIDESLHRGVSLTEIVAEHCDPERLKLIRGWYAVAATAIRHEIRLTWPEGIRLRLLTAFRAHHDDPRAIIYPTYGMEWGKNRAAVVLWVDVVSPDVNPRSLGKEPLVNGSLAAFLAERGSRTFTSAIFVEQARAKGCLKFPKIGIGESGEDYFRRIAEEIADAGVLRVTSDDLTYTILKNYRTGE